MIDEPPEYTELWDNQLENELPNSLEDDQPPPWSSHSSLSSRWHSLKRSLSRKKESTDPWVQFKVDFQNPECITIYSVCGQWRFRLVMDQDATRTLTLLQDHPGSTRVTHCMYIHPRAITIQDTLCGSTVLLKQSGVWPLKYVISSQSHKTLKHLRWTSNNYHLGCQLWYKTRFIADYSRDQDTRKLIVLQSEIHPLFIAAVVAIDLQLNHFASPRFCFVL